MGNKSKLKAVSTHAPKFMTYIKIYAIDEIHENPCESIKSMKIKLNADSIANFNPLVLKAKAMNIKITIGNGM